eukprot:m.130560 g.130560  ORF g.130560 m.130560 type:complete len:406 (-) comp29485_c0_seq3:236-1453(-)
MSVSSNKEAQQQLHNYLDRALAVTAPTKIQIVMKKNGVVTLQEFISLCDQEREELYEELKNGGIVLGDRSKLRRATPEAVANYLTLEATQINTKKKTSLLSKLFGDTNKEKNIENIADKESVASTPPPKRKSSSGSTSTSTSKSVSRTPSGVKYVGSLEGSPAWWKSHDQKIKRMAQAIKVNQPAYPWQGHNDGEDYQQLLWIRREEIMQQGFASDETLRKEWLALVLELDAATITSNKQESKADPKYTWYSKKNDESYKMKLLERRSEMLRMNLTKSSDLQAEWVVLMRELEMTLQQQWEATKQTSKVPTISITQDSPIVVAQFVDADGDVPSNSIVPAHNGRIQTWRNEVAKTLRPSESVASLMSEDNSEFTKSDVTRVASLASFYSGADADEFFSGSEDEEK